MESIFTAYKLEKETIVLTPINQGLINNTWKLVSGSSNLLLQKINDQVFKNPNDIAFNIDIIGSYLEKEKPDYCFLQPKRTVNDKAIFYQEGLGYFRIFPFVTNAHTINVVNTANQAYEAAAQFGKFTAALNGFNATQLKITLPNFHNLSFRMQQFETALNNATKERLLECSELINIAKNNLNILTHYDTIINSGSFKTRTTHHDTKISNVLFDNNQKGFCIIDLDTVMPGLLISDVGDMMRTYLSPVSEEEADVTKIAVRKEIYNAITEGYAEAMNGLLNNDEVKHFKFSGQYMVYMQAIRFLTDYLQNDLYYGCNYPTHNFVRARNQFALLQLINKEIEN